MSQRSTQINLSNGTADILMRNSMQLDWGIWANSGSNVPPEQIPGGTQAQWQSTSAGFATGTQGSVTYMVNGDATKLVTITWENPFIGDDNYTIQAPSGYILQFCDSTYQNCEGSAGDAERGNNATIYLAFSRAPHGGGQG